MLQLARGRTAGAFPILVTPACVAHARELLGDNATLVTALFAVLERNPERARAVARGPLGFLTSIPAYSANFRRMGFTDDDIDQTSDRLVDEITAWGTIETVESRVNDLLHAGGSGRVSRRLGQQCTKRPRYDASRRANGSVQTARNWYA